MVEFHMSKRTREHIFFIFLLAYLLYGASVHYAFRSDPAARYLLDSVAPAFGLATLMIAGALYASVRFLLRKIGGL